MRRGHPTPGQAQPDPPPRRRLPPDCRNQLQPQVRRRPRHILSRRALARLPPEDSGILQGQRHRLRRPDAGTLHRLHCHIRAAGRRSGALRRRHNLPPAALHRQALPHPADGAVRTSFPRLLRRVCHGHTAHPCLFMLHQGPNHRRIPGRHRRNGRPPVDNPPGRQRNHTPPLRRRLPRLRRTWRTRRAHSMRLRSTPPPAPPGRGDQPRPPPRPAAAPPRPGRARQPWRQLRPRDPPQGARLAAPRLLASGRLPSAAPPRRSPHPQRHAHTGGRHTAARTRGKCRTRRNRASPRGRRHPGRR